MYSRLQWWYSGDRFQKTAKLKDIPKKPKLYGLLALNVTVTDDECQPVDLVISYSTDQRTWLPCDPTKEITLKKVQTSPEGKRVAYTWDSFKFLGARRLKVWFKFQAVGSNSCTCVALIDNTCLRDD
jgi:hypothetical protein